MDESRSIHEKGELYIVATPIGNKDDITLRALRVLGKVDLIAAEDTRLTRRLLAYHNIKGHFISYHEHNEAQRTRNLIHKLKKGISIALVSNAGTPAVSDPGYRLINEAIANGIRIFPIPGASAAIGALSAAGLPTDTFVFVGFSAKKHGKRINQLRQLATEQRTLVFYESPKRIVSFLDEMITVMGDRYGVLIREMTKVHEEFIRGHLSEIQHNLNKRPAVKGECTLLVMGNENSEAVSMEMVRKELRNRLSASDQSFSEIVKAVAKKYGVSKNETYSEALNIKEEGE